MKRKKPITYIEKFFDELIIKSWWVILFICIGLIFFNQAMGKRAELTFALEKRLHALQNKKRSEEFIKDDFALRIQSQSDPAWVELILQKELGVVPDGYIKVNFVEK